jgi:hypothetical protein
MQGRARTQCNALEVIMQDTEKMCRVICGHRWNGLDEWVDCLYRLAELTDEEISQISAARAPRRQS